jgi:NAD(P)-dependent dehydrogenase (short-subunit alcohol dehydrogenase family)
VHQLDGRVAIITGAGRGIGREHALLFAAEGAKVVVNDLGGSPEGTGSDGTPAEEVVAEIVAAGGEAIANHDDITDFDAAKRLVESAVEAFGDLHVLVNNAGILRDRMLTNMTEEEWDAVIKVHLKGHFAPMRHAAAYWRERAKAGESVSGSVINTSSTSGLFGNVGQTNYGAAKMGIAALTIIGAAELGRYGVRVNAIAPAARTRLTQDLGGASSQPVAADQFDRMDPANVSPWVAYLATEGCPITGRSFLVYGGNVELFQPFAIVDKIEKDGRWTPRGAGRAGPPPRRGRLRPREPVRPARLRHPHSTRSGVAGPPWRWSDNARTP